MATIKFSYRYTKMPEGFERSKVLAVFITSSDRLHSDFIDYDTAIVGGGHYSPPSGKLIIILLQTMESSEIWTTMRRWTPSKEHYYRGMCGSCITSVIEDPVNGVIS